MTFFRLAPVLVLGMLLVGCSTVPVSTYKPPIANTELLLKHQNDQLAVGRVDAASNVPNSKLNVRADALVGTGPYHTFSAYLQDALTAELNAAGRLNPKSPTHIDAILMRNDLDSSGVSKGAANLSALFVVVRDDHAIYNKTLSVHHEWESSFLGGIAIPAAIQNYSTAVQKLVGELFADPDFVLAVDGSNEPSKVTQTP